MRVQSVLILGLVLGLGACASPSPSLPPLPDAERPPIKPSEDWKDWGPEENKKARESEIKGMRLDTAAITQTFRGKVLRGCYPNGERFAETLSSDGKFSDAANKNAPLGTWSVTNAQLCFRYPDRAAQGAPDSCFAVVRRGDFYDFYTVDLRQRVASTECSAS